MNQPKFYRDWIASNLIRFIVRDGESDIHISIDKDLKPEAGKLVSAFRQDITSYIQSHPAFKTSLKPLSLDDSAPDIVKAMLHASISAGVGPMAAVAGAISEFTGKELMKKTHEVILENGGDIFIKTNTKKSIAIYAGNSPLSGKVKIKIRPEDTPLGVCTSSGTVGHSLSFGKADAVSVLARSATLADASATAACNKIKKYEDIEKALEITKKIDGVIGAVVIYDKKLGTIGEIELI